MQYEEEVALQRIYTLQQNISFFPLNISRLPSNVPNVFIREWMDQHGTEPE